MMTSLDSFSDTTSKHTLGGHGQSRFPDGGAFHTTATSLRLLLSISIVAIALLAALLAPPLQAQTTLTTFISNTSAVVDSSSQLPISRYELRNRHRR